MNALAKARDVASRYLTSRGYPDEANAVAGGAGDDFAEVRIALAMVADEQKRMRRYEQALAAYADDDFWDGESGSPAATDRGAIARAALTQDKIAQHAD